MAEIKYEHQKVISLSGEEDVINEYTPNYVIVFNNTDNTVYISKERNVYANCETNKVKTILPGMADYLAGEKGVNDRFFALGKGDIDIKEAATLQECLAMLSEYYINLRKANCSNPNLLINPDFAVNQRGKTNYDTAGYTVDGWKLFSTTSESLGSVNVCNDGIVLAGGDNEMDTHFCQFFEDSFGDKFANKIITVSFEIENVTGLGICCAQYGRNSSSDLFLRVTQDGTYKVTGVWEPLSTTKRHGLMFYNRAAHSSAKIKWVKLEIGNRATSILNLYNPSEELIKCQRYYQTHTTDNVAEIDLRPLMRAKPQITKIGDELYSYSAEL